MLLAVAGFASGAASQRLDPFTRFSGKVDIATAAVSSADSGTLDLASVPAGVTILKVYYYFATIDNHTVSSHTFAGVSLPVVQIGLQPGTSSAKNARGYRNDVTDIVTGNGSYAFARQASGWSRGAALLVVYQDTALADHFDLWVHDGIDGGSTADGGNCPWATPPMFVFNGASTPCAVDVTYLIQGGQPGYGERYLFGAGGGALVAITDNDPATLGMEFDRYDVSPFFAGGETTASANCCELTDAILWLAAVMRVRVGYAPATVVPLGTGCGAQPPLLAAPGGNLPVLGTTFTFDLLSPASPGLFAMIAAGTSTSYHSSLGVALPYDLGPYGLTGCILRCSDDLGVITGVLDGSGLWSNNLTVPNDPTFCGLPICLQGFAAGPNNTPTAPEIFVSNGLRCIVGT
ncbi:MAG: hypothetical protein KDC98_23970 [Planctomycetes bacterium]|nr:hypothetical protein [Planctomycetota bacterium]